MWHVDGTAGANEACLIAYAAGRVALVTPDGEVRRVAEGLAFPNGMAVTPDSSTPIVSESFAGALTAFDVGPDGACRTGACGPRCPGDGIVLDTEGAVWTPGWTEAGPACLQVAEGGAVLDTVPLDRGRVRLRPRWRRRTDAVHAGGGLAHGGRLRGQHQAADDRAGDRSGAHRPRPGRPRRPP
jgi:hypothetical protein